MACSFLSSLGNILFSCCDNDNKFDRSEAGGIRDTQNRNCYYYQFENDNVSNYWQPNKGAKENRYQHYQYGGDGTRENRLAHSRVENADLLLNFGCHATSYASPSKLESNAPKSPLPTKIASKVVVSGQSQIKPTSDRLKLDIPSSFPSKIVSASSSSSSPQRPNSASVAQWKAKSNTSKNSLPTKSVQSLPPHKSDEISLPNNSVTKPTNASRMQYVPKKDVSANSSLSKPVPTVSPTPKTSSPIYSIKNYSASPSTPSHIDLNSCKFYALSKTGPSGSEFRDARLNNSPINESGTDDNIEDAEVGTGGTQRYEIPKHIEELIKNDIVPPVLKMPLSPDTYAEYFAALLYAEDFYCEKWSNYLLEGVTLKLRIKENPGLQNQYDKSKGKKDLNSKKQKEYPYVAFEIENVPERRPFLLSRDHVHLMPVGKNTVSEPFHGVLARVEKGTTVLAEFKDDFHEQHEPSKKYDVSFSFNRVCLKRAHRAVSAAANPVVRQILFPNLITVPTQRGQDSLMERILNKKLAPIPYLIEGPLCHNKNESISDMLITLNDLVVKIYKSCNDNRVLICATTNRACDSFMRLIMNEVPEFDLFRANAAFRDIEKVPDDIMQASIFRGECFTCPSLEKLKKFRIITSTFISSFRLYNAGLKAGHFSHIILMDASSAMEPEAIVALADLASEETVVVVTGSAEDYPKWIRSDIGRQHGLRKSFFKRLLKNEPYNSDNPLFTTYIE